MPKKAKGTVAAAAMTGGAAGGIGAGLTGKEIEEAMHKATAQALKDGITDPAKVLKLKLKAREDLKAAHRKTSAE